jgi:hypothetical protein
MAGNASTPRNSNANPTVTFTATLSPWPADDSKRHTTLAYVEDDADNGWGEVPMFSGKFYPTIAGMRTRLNAKTAPEQVRVTIEVIK